MFRQILAARLLLAAGHAVADEVTFSLPANDDGRYPIDADKPPFFYQADTSRMLLSDLTQPDATKYMGGSQCEGLQVMLTGFLGMKQREGHESRRLWPLAGSRYAKHQHIGGLMGSDRNPASPASRV